jgi:glutathione synthase
MKVGFVVNDVATELPQYTTNRLAMAAKEMGHEAWFIGIGDFSYQPDGSLSSKARMGHAKTYRSLKRHLHDVQKPDVEQLIGLEEFDVVMLRNDPADDAEAAPWANNAGVAFGQLIANSGVLVVNDPTSLANALSKAYFQHFPEVVRPRTLISRDQASINDFIEDLGGKAVLKPLQGSGGNGVFLIDRKEGPNFRQIVDAISRDGYVVAQEYLPEAKNGDIRLFVMNGQPLQLEGQYAAFRRTNKTDDMRSNISAGGKAEKVTVTDTMLELVEIVRPKLVSDGMFLAGLDIVGDKLMEINVFSPGGLGTAQTLYEVNFASAIIEELQRKVRIRKYHGEIGNSRLATS